LLSRNDWHLADKNMGAGHGGKSGRYISLEEAAEEYAFLIAQALEARAT
jgi:protease II